jgi:hypothetical protein
VIVKVLSVLECSRLPHISLLVYNGLWRKMFVIFEVLRLSLTLGDDGYHIGPLLMLVSSIAFDTLPNSIQGTSIGINLWNLEMKEVGIKKKSTFHMNIWKDFNLLAFWTLKKNIIFHMCNGFNPLTLIYEFIGWVLVRILTLKNATFIISWLE